MPGEAQNGVHTDLSWLRETVKDHGRKFDSMPAVCETYRGRIYADMNKLRDDMNAKHTKLLYLIIGEGGFISLLMVALKLFA